MMIITMQLIIAHANLQNAVDDDNNDAVDNNNNNNNNNHNARVAKNINK